MAKVETGAKVWAVRGTKKIFQKSFFSFSIILQCPSCRYVIPANNFRKVAPQKFPQNHEEAGLWHNATGWGKLSTELRGAAPPSHPPHPHPRPCLPTPWLPCHRGAWSSSGQKCLLLRTQDVIRAPPPPSAGQWGRSVRRGPLAAEGASGLGLGPLPRPKRLSASISSTMPPFILPPQACPTDSAYYPVIPKCAN